MRALQAGREVPWQPAGGRRRLEWHPIAWTLLRIVGVVVLAYAVVTTGFSLLREYRVDAWSGPDAAVTSGQRLEDCPDELSLHDATFPSWIRFDGHLFLGTEATRPVVSDTDYPPTAYQLGAMHLLRVANTPDGKAGKTIVLKLEGALTGQVYVRSENCS